MIIDNVRATSAFSFLAIMFCCEPVFAKSAATLVPFVEILDRNETGELVANARTLDEDLKLLNLELVEKAFKAPGRERSQRQIYLLSDCFLRKPKEFGDSDEYRFPTAGSAGCVVRIFIKEGREWRMAFKDNLIDAHGLFKETKKSMPDILIQVHGIYFDRAGSWYGLTKLKYTNGQYRFDKAKGGRLIEVKKMPTK